MKIFLPFFLLVIILSCKSKDDSAVPNEYAAKFIRELNTTDTFHYKFAVDKKGQFDSFSKKLLIEFQKHLGLKSLDKGFESIQIRIDFDCVKNSRESLIILTHNREKWIAELLNIKQNYSENMKLESITGERVNANPKSGWVNFINKLFGLKILTIEDNYRIPDFEYYIPTDGCGVGIEIATKSVYRFYSYDNPSFYSEKYWQAANVIAIQKLLYDEFDILTRWDEQREEARKKYLEEREQKSKENKTSGTIKINEITIPPDTASIPQHK